MLSSKNNQWFVYCLVQKEGREPRRLYVACRRPVSGEAEIPSENKCVPRYDLNEVFYIHRNNTVRHHS